MKILEFATRIDLDETAHDELPHLDLHTVCLLVLHMIKTKNSYFNFSDIIFVVCFLGSLRVQGYKPCWGLVMFCLHFLSLQKIIE